MACRGGLQSDQRAHVSVQLWGNERLPASVRATLTCLRERAKHAAHVTNAASGTRVAQSRQHEHLASCLA